MCLVLLPAQAASHFAPCAAGSGKLDAEIANAISSPAIITCQAKDQSLADLKRKILLKKALLDDHKVSAQDCVAKFPEYR
jgi:hypothetical protein